MRRFSPLGLSVYLSSFGQVHPLFENPAEDGILVFTSLHISEEFSDDYCDRARTACHWLAGQGYRVVADVSKKTVAQFGTPDMLAFAHEMRLYGLRIDYGFSEDEILAIAKHLPVAVNASTIDPGGAARIAAAGGQLVAMHNYYPRPETGLGDEFFRRTTQELQARGVQVFAFIAGDGEKRGPLHEGLPTLEKHRSWPPLCAYADLMVNFRADAVFVGDVTVTAHELAHIRTYTKDSVLPIPAKLNADYAFLYGKVFTSRPDSPEGAIRLSESREYSCFGETVEPRNSLPRPRGSITVDNIRYGRYSGELQVLRCDRPADARVNIIGQVSPCYLPLVDCVPNGSRLMLVPE